MMTTNSRVSRREGKIFAIIITLIALLPALNYFLNNVAIQLTGGALPLSMFLYSLLFLSEIYALSLIFRKSIANWDSVLVSLIVVFLTYLSYLLYNDKIGSSLIAPSLNPMDSQAVFLVLFCLPAFIICSSINNWSYLRKSFAIVSPVVVLLGFYAFYRQGFSVYGEGKMDYMSLSYYILTSSCFCFYIFLDRFNLFYGIVSFAGVFVILAAGCRGALLCYSVFAILMIIRQFSTSSQKKYSWLINVFLIIVIVSAISSSIFSIQFISGWFDSLGISSRAVDMMSEGTFLEDSARNNIRNSLWQGIMDNPFGYGLFGDRYVAAKYYSIGVEYSHNIIYELLTDFGFWGLFLFFGYIIKSTRSFYKKFKRDNMWVVFLLFVPEGFVELFFSGSFLLDVKFWILLALLVNRKRLSFVNMSLH